MCFIKNKVLPIKGENPKEGRTILLMKRIIGFEEAKLKGESAQKTLFLSAVDELRPKFCPNCFSPARKDGKFVLTGHGGYQRYVSGIDYDRIRVQRFLCLNCDTTTSVRPHWVLPYYRYPAPLVLEAIYQYCVTGKTTREIGAGLGLGEGKAAWGTITRWSCAFLLFAALWGCFGAELGAGEEKRRSRSRTALLVKRFLLRFSESTHQPDFPYLVDRSLGETVFDGTKFTPCIHLGRGKKSALTASGGLVSKPTQFEGTPRAPP